MFLYFCIAYDFMSNYIVMLHTVFTFCLYIRCYNIMQAILNDTINLMCRCLQYFIMRKVQSQGIQRPKTAPSIYEYGSVFPEYRANQMRTIPVLRTSHAWPYTRKTRNADETVFHTCYSSFFAVCNRVRSVVSGAPVPFRIR